MNPVRSLHLARTATTRRPRDPDFDSTNPPVAGPTRDVVRFYQRLVVNPFLGVGGALLTLLLCLFLTEMYLTVLLIPAAALGLFASYMLIHFHCLDCGATGGFHRWWAHSCTAIWERWNQRQSFWHRFFPDAPTQLALWFVMLALFGFLIAVVVRTH